MSKERDAHAYGKFGRVYAFYLVFPAFGDFIFGLTEPARQTKGRFG